MTVCTVAHVLCFAALAMLQAYADSTPSDSLSTPSPFVYLSAEDLFRPFVSPRYIETKREAEQLILEKLASNSADVETHHREIRPVFIRPSESTPSWFW